MSNNNTPKSEASSLFVVTAKESKDSLERSEAALKLAQELDEDAERELLDRAIAEARSNR